MSVRKNPDLITTEEKDFVPTSCDQCFLFTLDFYIFLYHRSYNLFYRIRPVFYFCFLIHLFIFFQFYFCFCLALKTSFAPLPDGHSLTFSGSGYVKYHLMENENKELMRLSLKLRTFSTHATVMYAKGTDYSILEVRLSLIYLATQNFCGWLVIFPYQSSIKTKTKKIPFLPLMRASSSEHQPC